MPMRRAVSTMGGATNSSLGRLTLNILLSFAQFEREIISERTRDKQVAARKKGKWTGGHLVLGVGS
jgi:site-specific DNA recombinase